MLLTPQILSSHAPSAKYAASTVFTFGRGKPAFKIYNEMKSTCDDKDMNMKGGAC